MKTALIIVGIIVVIGIVGVGAVAFVFAKSVDTVTNAGRAIVRDFGTAPSSAYDLKIAECTTDDTGSPIANGTITNKSGRKHGFRVTVGFYDDNDVKLGEGFDVVNSLSDGTSAKFSSTTFSSSISSFTCRVDDVSFNG